MNNSIINWLKDHPLINIRGLEKEAGIPLNTLKLVMLGERDLPIRHVEPIKKALEKYGYKG